jgi:hypothetical protein
MVFHAEQQGMKLKSFHLETVYVGTLLKAKEIYGLLRLSS